MYKSTVNKSDKKVMLREDVITIYGYNLHLKSLFYVID